MSSKHFRYPNSKTLKSYWTKFPSRKLVSLWSVCPRQKLSGTISYRYRIWVMLIKMCLFFIRTTWNRWKSERQMWVLSCSVLRSVREWIGQTLWKGILLSIGYKIRKLSKSYSESFSNSAGVITQTEDRSPSIHSSTGSATFIGRFSSWATRRRFKHDPPEMDPNSLV